MTLPERLHHILVKLRESFDTDLPDPAELEHSGELEIRGQMFTTRSSVPLDELPQAHKFTIYLHSRPADGAEGGEHLFFFHFEGRHEISSVFVKLDVVEGNVRQNVTLSSLPREIFLQMVERRLGRGPPRERRRHGGHGGRGGGPHGGRGGGRGFHPRPPAAMDESDDSL